MPYFDKPWKCLCCGQAKTNFPSGGVIFHSQGGNYGSAVYDDIVGGHPHRVVGGVCDECFVAKVKDGTFFCVMEKPKPPVEEYMVKWDPEKEPPDLRPPQQDYGDPGETLC